MLNQMDTIIRMRHDELLREAKTERLAKQAGAVVGSNAAPLYYEALAALGRGLSALGDELQARYGDLCQEVNYQPHVIGSRQ